MNPAVLLVALYKVVLTFKSVDESLVYHHSNDSYRAVISGGTGEVLTFARVGYEMIT